MSRWDDTAVRTAFSPAVSFQVRFDRLRQVAGGKLYRAKRSATEGACLKTK